MKLKTILFLTTILGTHLIWADDKESDKSSGTLIAEEALAPAQNFGISVEAIGLFSSGLGLKFEYFATDKVSIGLGGSYMPGRLVETTSQKSKYYPEYAEENNSYRLSHNEINLGTNIMLTGTLSTNGVYFNPSLGYQNTRIYDYSKYKLQGSLSSPQVRATGGYQWVNSENNIRFAAGGGLRLIKSSDIVIKDENGQELLRQSSNNLGGLAVDLQLGYLF